MIRIFSLEKVKVETFAEVIRVRPQTDLKLECKVSGYPLPHISWFIGMSIIIYLKVF